MRPFFFPTFDRIEAFNFQTIEANQTCSLWVVVLKSFAVDFS
jgi:hypothetical protein